MLYVVLYRVSPHTSLRCRGQPRSWRDADVGVRAALLQRHKAVLGEDQQLKEQARRVRLALPLQQWLQLQNRARRGAAARRHRLPLLRASLRPALLLRLKRERYVGAEPRTQSA